MGSGFERGRYARSDLVIHIEELKSAPKRPSTWFRPQLEGSGYTPFSGQTVTWQGVQRPSKNDPLPEQIKERWVERE
jgi:hypothetical protein